MAKFKLTPVSDHLSDPIWQQSEPPHEACYAAAETENDARDHASSHFRPMRERIGFEKIITESPWLDPRITICAAVAEISGDPMPNGLVQRESETWPRR